MIDFEGYEGFKILNKDMLDVFAQVYDCAHKGYSMIMFGPKGAGKEFLSRYYFAQYRKITKSHGKFISLDCSELAPETAHSILFGQDQRGAFELAQGGVIFLDEIGNLDNSIQTRINRAMNEDNPEAFRLGQDLPYSTKNVKVICATESTKEDLNESLLLRAGHQIFVPGLDARDEDVEEAIKYFCLRAIDQRLDCEEILSKLAYLKKYEEGEDPVNYILLVDLIESIATRLGPIVRNRDWPGNFRALRAAVNSGVICANRLSSADDFIDDVEKHFLDHLGKYSIDNEEEQLSPMPVTPTAPAAGASAWLTILNHLIPDMNDDEKLRLSKFLHEYEDIPFKRKSFETFMNLSTRNAQLRIKKLNSAGVLKEVPGKGYKYRVRKEQGESGRQGINPSHFMELPAPGDKDFLPVKNLEAQTIIENTRGLFISDDDPEKRTSFFGTLGAMLQENHDLIYFSFHKHSLDDFISSCIEYLNELKVDGWFKYMKDDQLEMKEKISGLAGYFIQSLSKHRKTIIILEGIDVFKTGESQAFIEQMIYYWYPVKFVLGSRKKFFHQQFSDSTDLTELILSDLSD